MKQKRVFVLGAGSSIGHSNGIFPSVKDFFRVAKQHKIINTEEFENLITYISESMGVDVISESRNIDIEKLATMIEIEIERNPSAKMLGVRENLLNLIEKVLSKISRQIGGNDGEFYLLKNILRPNDTVLTFNWDLLLDDILDRAKILKELYKENGDRDKCKGQYLNFIYRISSPGEATWDRLCGSVPYSNRNWEADTGYLLKLHGSIDWFYCSNEQCRAYNKVYPLLERDFCCGECHESLLRLLIPPVLNKAYRQYPLIRKIWNLAVKEISVADEVVVWGYSLPPTDFYAYWLLKHTWKNCKKIVLINPKVKRKTTNMENVTFLKPFRDVFSMISGNKIELYECFTNYCR
jgi:hypothetical protein